MLTLLLYGVPTSYSLLHELDSIGDSMINTADLPHRIEIKEKSSETAYSSLPQSTILVRYAGSITSPLGMKASRHFSIKFGVTSTSLPNIVIITAHERCM